MGRSPRSFKTLQVGDEVLVGKRSTGTLGSRQYASRNASFICLATGTGLAPFMSIIKDPEIYDQFEKIILAHGVREVSELAYSDYIENILPNDEYLGEMVREKLVYYPTVTRETL
jgi:ferredoxin--NADP+ reductase